MRIVTLAGLLLLLLAAWVFFPAPSKPAPDVVMLVVDTLRADVLAHYGNTTGLTPFLNELATRSNVVTRTYSQATWTNPSVASLFTSRYPSQHGIKAFNSVLAGDEETLAESLAAAGYATAGFSANGLLANQFGFDQGFDLYKSDLKLVNPKDPLMRLGRRASELLEEALSWLDSVPREGDSRKPVFLYFQFMETHTPYAPPKALLDRVRGAKPALDLKAINQAAVLAKAYPPTAGMLQDIRDTYDASVLEIDGELRRIVAALGERGVGDDALIIVTADHGDEFQEHGGLGHGAALYDETLRVPLLVRTPGQTDGSVVERLVSLIDLAPTVLELAGVPKPAHFEGTSFALDLRPDGLREKLRRMIARLADDRPDPVAYSEREPLVENEPTSAHARSCVVGSFKLIESADNSRVFFSLATDPGEQRTGEVGEAERRMLETRLEAVQSRIRSSTANAEERELDEQAKEALRAFGYAQ